MTVDHRDLLLAAQALLADLVDEADAPCPHGWCNGLGEGGHHHQCTVRGLQDAVAGQVSRAEYGMLRAVIGELRKSGAVVQWWVDSDLCPIVIEVLDPNDRRVRYEVTRATAKWLNENRASAADLGRRIAGELQRMLLGAPV